MRLIATLAVFLGFGGIAFLLTGKNQSGVQSATVLPHASENKSADSTALAENNLSSSNAKLAEGQVDLHLQNLRQAVHENDGKSKSDSLRELSKIVMPDSAALQNIVARIKTEPDAEMLFAIGQLVLDTGVPQYQKLVTDTALNLLLSDDTAARRKASLAIVANSPALTAELCQAIVRVSREDSSAEIKDEAAATIEKWMADRPDFRPKIKEALSMAHPANSDQTNLSAPQE